MFQGEVDRYISANPSINMKFNRFSFGVNLVLWHPRSTNLLFGPLTFKPDINLGSLQIESLQHLFFILLNIGKYKKKNYLYITFFYQNKRSLRIGQGGHSDTSNHCLFGSHFVYFCKGKKSVIIKLLLVEDRVDKTGHLFKNSLQLLVQWSMLCHLVWSKNSPCLCSF